MPEFRQNFVTKEWVIIASERAKRPDQVGAGRLPRPQAPAFREDCPFCPGHEDRTPPPVMVSEQGGQWAVLEGAIVTPLGPGQRLANCWGVRAVAGANLAVAM